MSYRIERINEIIRSEISPIIGNIKNKYLGMVTVIAVETTPDLNQATIWISVMNKEKLKDDDIIRIIKQYTYEARNHLKKRLILKKMPKFMYRVDRSSEHVSNVEKIFEKLDK